MAVISLTTIPGVIAHYRSRHVYSRGVLIASIAAAIGVFLGTQLAIWTPSSMLKKIFGIACVGVGIYMLYGAAKGRGKIPPRVTIDEVKRLEAGSRLFALMFFAGIATGLCGFGGGIYYMPILNALGYPMHIAVGTSSAEMIFVAGVGAANLTIHGGREDDQGVDPEDGLRSVDRYHRRVGRSGIHLKEAAWRFLRS